VRVGILGSGLMGGKIGTIFARAGHDVLFSYARTRKKLEGLARNAGGSARAGSPRQAAQHGEVVLLAVHWSRVDDVLSQAGNLSGKLVITCTLPMNAADTKLVLGNTTSGAEAVAARLPRADVVAAFQTVPSEVLFGVFDARAKATRPSLVYCGGKRSGKRVAATLIDDVGFDPVDAGPLRIARYMEPFALLMAQLAYGGKGGPELAYRFPRFGS